ncbi:unnamed protein product [Clonostachys rosea f. rosea IK726]|uniref:Uncharacterized protein n=1 Tax=Clonostachys rosea f. rosea IK726 TaxID=1349383 RepID=A0ACA9UQU1_BIOOC|nr:unnamed protein product [Clonostachys rosea f. rosea IK726]
MPKSDGWTTQQRDLSVNVSDLSYILHPVHEVSTPEKKEKGQSPGKDKIDHPDRPLVEMACSELGLPIEGLNDKTQIYFRNMVAINLFHEPSFQDKLAAITSMTQICGLLAAMFSFAARFSSSDLNSAHEREFQPSPTAKADQLLNKALKYVNEALIECDDEPPPLCVVQALVIATHCQLTRGVHGKAWRSLGLCVRLAYELNLHLIDAGGIGCGDTEDALAWREEEERRRAWWAIWEMDVFASTIRRTPTAIDWAHMETLLPVDDWQWFGDRKSPSSFLEREPTLRWKSLYRSGNQSPKSWFLIINSLMKDAQILSSPHGVRAKPEVTKAGCQSGRLCPCGGEDTFQQLEILSNTIQCFVLALPSHLRYRGQHLSFDSTLEPRQNGSTHQLHCGIYNIFVMTQLARLMIHRYDLFHQPTNRDKRGQNSGISATKYTARPMTNVENLSRQQYFEAADNILAIVSSSCEAHVQHINPFLLSTIWLAAAVQLVRRYVCRSSMSSSLIKSRFDVLYMTYKRCVDFWDAETALQQNLETLETQLEKFFENQADKHAPHSFHHSKDSTKTKRSPGSWIPDEPCSTEANNEISDTATYGYEGQFHFVSLS